MIISLEEARTILGDEAKNMSDSQLEVIITNFEYLVDSWLEAYETKVFKRPLIIDNEP